MSKTINLFEVLAAAVRRGVTGAAEKFSAAMRPVLECEVRRELCFGTKGMVLGHKISKYLEQIPPASAGNPAEDPGRRVGLAAGRICAAMIEELRGNVLPENPRFAATVVGRNALPVGEATFVSLAG